MEKFETAKIKERKRKKETFTPSGVKENFCTE